MNVLHGKQSLAGVKLNQALLYPGRRGNGGFFAAQKNLPGFQNLAGFSKASHKKCWPVIARNGGRRRKNDAPYPPYGLRFPV
jgi:hypothetical protein